MADRDLKSQAVMNVDKGEEIAGLWATAQIPGIGIFKLTAKKRLDGKFEWVHFQHRLDGTRIYGVVMQIADFSASTSDGRKLDGPVQ